MVFIVMTGSRFVVCPVCGRSVALALINVHLDSPACNSAPASTPMKKRRLDAPQHEQSIQHSMPRSAVQLSSAEPFAWICFTGVRQKTPVLSIQHLRDMLPCEVAPFSASHCSTDTVCKHRLHRIAPECHSEPSVQVVVDALPAKLAEALLSVLLEDSLTYSRGRWRIFDQLKDMPRSTCHYALDNQARSLFVPVLLLYPRRYEFGAQAALVTPVNGTPAPKIASAP